MTDEPQYIKEYFKHDSFIRQKLKKLLSPLMIYLRDDDHYYYGKYNYVHLPDYFYKKKFDYFPINLHKVKIPKALVVGDFWIITQKLSISVPPNRFNCDKCNY